MPGLLARWLLGGPLDLVDPRELHQREFGDLALVGCVQVEDLAPGGGRQATGLGHPLTEAGLVPGVVVADQAATSVMPDGCGMLAGARRRNRRPLPSCLQTHLVHK
jgi:hypothetical protein